MGQSVVNRALVANQRRQKSGARDEDGWQRQHRAQHGLPERDRAASVKWRDFANDAKTDCHLANRLAARRIEHDEVADAQK